MSSDSLVGMCLSNDSPGVEKISSETVLCSHCSLLCSSATMWSKRVLPDAFGAGPVSLVLALGGRIQVRLKVSSSSSFVRVGGDRESWVMVLVVTMAILLVLVSAEVLFRVGLWSVDGGTSGGIGPSFRVLTIAVFLSQSYFMTTAVM